jgi:ABC-2 type transport system ATP-binding protein
MFFGKLYGMNNAELKSKVDELLDMMKLTPFKDRSVGGFSSGMRQRMNLIRALIHDPEIIFLDEPTTALDPQSTKFVRDTVLDLKKAGHTIILTTHIMEEADELSDRISIIDHGKIMASGTVAGLKNEYGTQSMLEVFLTVTGRELRDSASDRVSMKAVGRM